MFELPKDLSAMLFIAWSILCMFYSAKSLYMLKQKKKKECIWFICLSGLIGLSGFLCSDLLNKDYSDSFYITNLYDPGYWIFCLTLISIYWGLKAYYLSARTFIRVLNEKGLKSAIKDYSTIIVLIYIPLGIFSIVALAIRMLVGK